MIGQVAGNYRIIAKLGEGGMGTVYKAVDVMVEREVAIKMLRPEIARRPELLERFRAEAVTLAKLNHPSIATLFSFFRQGDEYFMAMEYVPGRTLEAVLAEQGRFAVEPAVRIMAKVLDGIDHAHRLGILHRDIKPANIMLTPADAVKVTDFGIARVLGAARMTREGHIVGTMEYLAPERIKGQESDLRSDIYSLGAVLYEMLTGHVPFEANTDFELMRAHLEAPPRPVREFQQEVPPGVEAAILKALAKNPGERFSTASEFQAALLAGVGEAAADTLGVPVSVKPTRLAEVEDAGPAQAMPAPAPRRGWSAKHYAVLAATVVLVMVAAIVAAMLLRRAPPRPQPQIAQPVQQQLPAPAPVAQQPPPAAPVTLPEDLQPKSPDALKAVTPIPTPVSALGEAPKRAAPPARKAVDREAERRKAALRALGVDEGKPEKKSAEQPSSEDSRKSALKALEK